jgi:hypothetical protein
VYAEVFASDLEIQGVTIRFPEYPVNFVKPVPQLPGYEVRDEKNGDRAIVLGEHRGSDCGEIRVSVVDGKHHRVLIERSALLDVFNETGQTHEAIFARAQILEIRAKNGGIVAGDAEIGHGEAVKKKNICAMPPKRREERETDIARDS